MLRMREEDSKERAIIRVKNIIDHAFAVRDRQRSAEDRES
jgi:hypothetical protein